MFISNNIGIIADDLTGADDTSLQFHLRGANTQILLDYSIIPENKISTQVWAIPTETRNSDAPTAYERVKQATNVLAETYNVEYFYKKMDSTLRGHIAVEALAMLDALEWDAAVIIPTEHDIPFLHAKKGFLSPLPPCVAGRADADLSFPRWCGERRRSLRLRYTMPQCAEG